jgi:replicative DNA helicase
VSIQKIAIKQLLIDKDTYLLNQLNSSYFTKSYKTIYKVIEEYYDNKNKLPTKIDLISLFENKLSESRAETFKAIIKSLDKINTNMSAEEILKELKKHKLLVEVESKLEDLVKAGENKDVNKLMCTINDLNNKVNNIENDYVPELVQNIEFKNVNLAKVESFLPTLRDNGIDLYGVSIVASPSGHGKSNFVLQQALHTYAVEGKSVGFISLELDNSLLLLRMYSQATNTPFKEIMSNPNKKTIIDEWKAEYFNRENRFYIKYRRYTVEELLATVKLLAKEGVKLIVIDYLNLVSFPNGEEWKHLSNLVKDLHELAINNGLVILSPSQVNIEESKGGNITAVSRGSKELEFSASVFLVLYANNEEKQENVSRLIIQKSRNSKKLNLMVKTDFTTMQFEDLKIIV